MGEQKLFSMVKPTNRLMITPTLVCILSAFFLWQPLVKAAFVPANPVSQTKQRVDSHTFETNPVSIVNLSNQEIERLTGKKLRLTEKIGLYLLRKEAAKQEKRLIKAVRQNPEDCFTMYLKNGDVLEVNVIQITPNEIKYRRCNKPGDPEIVISKNNVFNIKDKDGDTIFSSQTESWKKATGTRTGKTDSGALASGILGIASLTVGLIFWPIGLAAGIVAFVLGLSALRRFRNDNNITGEGWAITGVTAGGLWLFIGLLLLIALGLY